MVGGGGRALSTRNEEAVLLSPTPKGLGQCLRTRGDHWYSTFHAFCDNLEDEDKCQAAAWHRYGLLWDASGLTFFIDDEETAHRTARKVIQFPQQDMFFLLNNGVLSDPKASERHTPWPNMVEFDYLRLYKKIDRRGALVGGDVRVPNGFQQTRLCAGESCATQSDAQFSCHQRGWRLCSLEAVPNPKCGWRRSHPFPTSNTLDATASHYLPPARCASFAKQLYAHCCSCVDCSDWMWGMEGRWVAVLPSSVPHWEYFKGSWYLDAEKRTFTHFKSLNTGGGWTMQVIDIRKWRTEVRNFAGKMVAKGEFHSKRAKQRIYCSLWTGSSAQQRRGGSFWLVRKSLPAYLDAVCLHKGMWTDELCLQLLRTWFQPVNGAYRWRLQFDGVNEEESHKANQTNLWGLIQTEKNLLLSLNTQSPWSFNATNLSFGPIWDQQQLQALWPSREYKWSIRLGHIESSSNSSNSSTTSSRSLIFKYSTSGMTPKISIHFAGKHWLLLRLKPAAAIPT